MGSWALSPCFLVGRRPSGLTWLRVGSQEAPVTLRLFHRWPLARSQWPRALCCPSAFPGSEACMALHVCSTAFTKGLLGCREEVQSGAQLRAQPVTPTEMLHLLSGGERPSQGRGGSPRRQESQPLFSQVTARNGCSGGLPQAPQEAHVSSLRSSREPRGPSHKHQAQSSHGEGLRAARGQDGWVPSKPPFPSNGLMLPPLRYGGS